MNPVKQIGRYEIPIGSVVMTTKRTGFWAFFRPGYDVLLTTGITLRLTSDEKAQLDEARGTHEKVMSVWGMIQEQKRNNQPAKA